jgi:hypothetical protein
VAVIFRYEEDGNPLVLGTRQTRFDSEVSDYKAKGTGKVYLVIRGEGDMVPLTSV